MNTAKRFTNFSNETFIGVWNKEQFPFKAGETMLLQGYLADHFAKHLIDRELGKLGIPVDRKDERERMLALAMGEVVIEATSPEKLEAEMLNEDEDKNERGASNPEESMLIEKKEKRTWKKKKSKDEEEFEG